MIIGQRVKIKENSRSGRTWYPMKKYEGETGVTVGDGSFVKFDDPGLTQYQDIEHNGFGQWSWYSDDLIPIE
jgi:hypothetical protein